MMLYNTDVLLTIISFKFAIKIVCSCHIEQNSKYQELLWNKIFWLTWTSWKIPKRWQERKSLMNCLLIQSVIGNFFNHKNHLTKVQIWKKFVWMKPGRWFSWSFCYLVSLTIVPRCDDAVLLQKRYLDWGGGGGRGGGNAFGKKEKSPFRSRNSAMLHPLTVAL